MAALIQIIIGVGRTLSAILTPTGNLNRLVDQHFMFCIIGLLSLLSILLEVSDSDFRD